MKGVSSNFNWVSMVFERSLKGASGKFQGCFKEVSKSFQEVSRVFQKSVKGIIIKLKRYFTLKKFWLKKILGLRKNCWSKKILGPKEI